MSGSAIGMRARTTATSFSSQSRAIPIPSQSVMGGALGVAHSSRAPESTCPVVTIQPAAAGP